MHIDASLHLGLLLSVMGLNLPGIETRMACQGDMNNCETFLYLYLISGFCCVGHCSMRRMTTSQNDVKQRFYRDCLNSMESLLDIILLRSR
jgi:hypothetical protein